MARVSRPFFRPPLRPTAALTLLAVILAVSAALVARHAQHDAERVIETRGRLALVLAAQTELALERLREALTAQAATLAPGEIPDAAALGALLDRLRQAAPAFRRLEVVDAMGEVREAAQAMDSAPAAQQTEATPKATENQGPYDTGAPSTDAVWLRDAAGSRTLAGGLYPGSEGTARVLLSWRLTPDGDGAHLRAEADVRALPAAESRPGAELLYVADDGTALAAGAGRPPELGRAAEAALGSLARAARDSGALAQREVPWPDGTRRIAVAAPLRGEPLTLVLLVPTRQSGGSSRTLPAVFLALGGVVLAMLPLLRNRRRHD